MAQSQRSAIRIALQMLARGLGLAPEAAEIGARLALLSLFIWLIGLPWLALAAALVTVAVCLFFRDPDRFIAPSDDQFVSGADGKVVEISERTLPALGGECFHMVSVFMSPLNVHINRAPVTGEVSSVEHTPGEFRAAFDDHASEFNERNLIVFHDGQGRRHAMMQVAGYLARRIVCNVRSHDKILQGQRLGLIMFGSRVDHYMPLDYPVSVKVGERVKSGETVLARWQAGKALNESAQAGELLPDGEGHGDKTAI